MNVNDLRMLEEHFGIELPEWYKNRATNYSQRLLDAKYSMWGKDECPADLQFLNDSDAILDLNRLVRSKKHWIMFGGDGQWLNSCFVIGHDKAGGYYFIDAVEAGQNIYFYEHETREKELYAQSMDEFETLLIEGVEEFKRETDQS